MELCSHHFLGFASQGISIKIQQWLDGNRTSPTDLLKYHHFGNIIKRRISNNNFVLEIEYSLTFLADFTFKKRDKCHWALKNTIPGSMMDLKKQAQKLTPENVFLVFWSDDCET
jgi:hypothetical protein